MNFTVLSEEEIQEYTATNSDWNYIDGKLQAEFTLGSFKDTMAVVQRVGEKADEMQHHPKWSNSYCTLQFAFCTHDAGNKITTLDTELAKFISEAVADTK